MCAWCRAKTLRRWTAAVPRPRPPKGTKGSRPHLVRPVADQRGGAHHQRRHGARLRRRPCGSRCRAALGGAGGHDGGCLGAFGCSQQLFVFGTAWGQSAGARALLAFRGSTAQAATAPRRCPRRPLIAAPAPSSPRAPPPLAARAPAASSRGPCRPPGCRAARSAAGRPARRCRPVGRGGA